MDPVSGSNSNNGMAGAAWASTDYAIKHVVPGDTVNLLPGDYGIVDFCQWCGVCGTGWDWPITVQADPDSEPYSARFTAIRLQQSYDMYYLLKGLAFIDSAASTTVYGKNARHVHMDGFLICGADDGTTGPDTFAVQYASSEDIYIENFTVYNLPGMGI